MPVAVKVAGSPDHPNWYVPAAGKIAVKQGAKGAGAWTIPASVKMKQGAKGSGSWFDSGYVGYPGIPTGLAVNAWDYDSVDLRWVAPSSGASVSSYEVQVLNQSGAQVGSILTSTTTNRNNIAVSQSTKYQMRVRAKGATGLLSGWTAVLKISIGKPQVVSYHNEQRSQSWQSPNVSYDNYRNEVTGYLVPDAGDGIHITNMVNYAYTNAAYYCDNSVSVGRWINVYPRGALLYTPQYAYRHPDLKASSGVVNLAMNCWSGEYIGLHMMDVGGWSYQAGGVHGWGIMVGQGIYYYTVQVQDVTPAVPNGYW